MLDTICGRNASIGVNKIAFKSIAERAASNATPAAFTRFYLFSATVAHFHGRSRGRAPWDRSVSRIAPVVDRVRREQGRFAIWPAVCKAPLDALVSLRERMVLVGYFVLSRTESPATEHACPLECQQGRGDHAIPALEWSRVALRHVTADHGHDG